MAELLRYLESRGHQTDLDEKAEQSAQDIASAREELRGAMHIGNRLKAQPAKVFAVPSFRRKLKPFQIPAVAHMVSTQHSANFSVPGSGKTTIALAAFAREYALGNLNTLVVIGPRSSFAPWESEFGECLKAKGPVVRVTGTKAQRARQWRKAENATLVILNYHVAASDSERLAELLRRRRAMVVLDESHHIKNIADTKWATAIRSMAPLASKRVILSGTPTPNSLADLWSQISFLYPLETPLGTREEFLARLDRATADTREDIRRRVWPLFWRIKKRDLGLSRPKIRKISVPLGRVQSAIYDGLALRVWKDTKTAPQEASKLRQWRRAKMIRLLQAASNPALLTRYSDEFKLPPLSTSGLTVTQLIDRYNEYEVPAKLTTAVSLIDQLLRAERKVVVWTAFVHNIAMLMKLLKSANPLPLYGGIPLSEEENREINRENIIERFCSDKQSKVLIANPAACAESISLHRASQDAIYIDRTFNCAHFLQSKDRIHRVGLDPRCLVTYHILVGAGTIDEVVDRRLSTKEQAMLELLERDFGQVALESAEDVVSEEMDEAMDFAETLRQLEQQFRDAHESE